MGLFKNLRYKNVGSLDTKKIADAVEAGYASKLRGDHVMHKVSFSPSSLVYGSGRCPRRWVMAFKGEYTAQDTFDTSSYAVVDHGTSAHTRIQAALEISGVVIEEEKEIKNEDPPIRGYIDNIIEIDGVQIPLEIKTTRQEAFEWRITSMKPTGHHMYQLLTYMKILGSKVGAFLYENKNDNSLLVIPVEMDEVNEQVINDAFEWMRLVHKQYEDGKLPARPWKQTSPNCKQCPLFKACWEDAPEGDVKIKPMKVHKW